MNKGNVKVKYCFILDHSMINRTANIHSYKENVMVDHFYHTPRLYTPHEHYTKFIHEDRLYSISRHGNLTIYGESIVDITSKLKELGYEHISMEMVKYLRTKKLNNILDNG